jgi:hypothetical protein
VPVSQRELLFNQVAQGLAPVDDLHAYVSSLDAEQRRAMLTELSRAVLEAHPLPTEIDDAIRRSQLKATYTPCVLLQRKSLRGALGAIRLLPDDEMRKAFHILVALLGVADERRRGTCHTACHHWWHQDLRDADVVHRLLTQ